MITSNSSPLILLAKINEIELLKKLYKKVYIPKEVYNEVIIKGKEEKYSDAFIIEKQINEFIFVKELNKNNSEEAEKLNRIIGTGESAAIMLSIQEKTNLLLIDNLEPRKIAEIKNIKCRSTPGIVLEALKSKIINVEEYEDAIKKLSEHAWLSGDIVAHFLEQANKFRRKK